MILDLAHNLSIKLLRILFDLLVIDVVPMQRGNRMPFYSWMLIVVKGLASKHRIPWYQYFLNGISIPFFAFWTIDNPLSISTIRFLTVFPSSAYCSSSSSSCSLSSLYSSSSSDRRHWLLSYMCVHFVIISCVHKSNIFIICMRCFANVVVCNIPHFSDSCVC